MKIEQNDPGGTTVVLASGDDLAAVPKSHADLITPAIRDAFRDPPSFFARLAERSPYAEMRKWLRQLIADDAWELQLHRDEYSVVPGFSWESDVSRGAIICLPAGEDLSNYPVELQQYYSLVGKLSWNGFGYPGGLAGPVDHMPLAYLPIDPYGDLVNVDSTFNLGESTSGNSIIYTRDGRGGWLNIGSHQVHLLGTIADTLNAVYAELCAGRGPEWNYAWAKPRN